MGARSLSVGCCMALAVFAASALAAQDDTSTSQSSDRLVDDAVNAIDDAAEALAHWRTAIERDEAIAEAQQARVETSLKKLLTEAYAIGELSRRRHQERQAAERKIAQSPDRRQLVENWVERLRAIGEGAAQQRAAAVNELREALESDDATRQYAALETLQKTGDVAYDKREFRSLVLPFVETSTGPPLVAACYALNAIGRQPGDLALVHGAWSRRSPALDNSMSHLLHTFGDAKIDGTSAEIVLELLNSPQADVRRECLRGLWGADVAEPVAARVVELADDTESRHDAIYFALSTFKPKHPLVVEKLIETLEDPDWNNWQRALWGLSYGVREEMYPTVAAALSDLYVARTDPKVRAECRELIGRYAGPEAVEKLPQ